MTRRYYSSRKGTNSLSVSDLYGKLQHLYLFFRDKDYFAERAGITRSNLPETVKHEAGVALDFQPFPITKWDPWEISEDHVFDVLEFLYDRVSKPGQWAEMTSNSGFSQWGHIDYDEKEGKREFREKANSFLADYNAGFELSRDGVILAKGSAGLQHILDAEIIPFDEKNVDVKVRNAISKWRNRHLSIAEKKEAIRELADVFEWLKKTQGLELVLDSKDESALFDIANNFAIRHHNPKQKANYDPNIWYSWIFHFYLATYHASVRLLLKKKGKGAHSSGHP